MKLDGLQFPPLSCSHSPCSYLSHLFVLTHAMGLAGFLNCKTPKEMNLEQS